MKQLTHEYLPHREQSQTALPNAKTTTASKWKSSFSLNMLLLWEKTEASYSFRVAEHQGGERRQQLRNLISRRSSLRLLLYVFLLPPALNVALSHGVDSGADKEAYRDDRGLSQRALTASSPPARRVRERRARSVRRKPPSRPSSVLPSAPDALG